jgi:hypothetical protein
MQKVEKSFEKSEEHVFLLATFYIIFLIKINQQLNNEKIACYNDV